MVEGLPEVEGYEVGGDVWVVEGVEHSLECLCGLVEVVCVAGAGYDCVGVDLCAGGLVEVLCDCFA